MSVCKIFTNIVMILLHDTEQNVLNSKNISTRYWYGVCEVYNELQKRVPPSLSKRWLIIHSKLHDIKLRPKTNHT